MNSLMQTPSNYGLNRMSDEDGMNKDYSQVYNKKALATSKG
jgi:hypothetical protein